MRFKLGEHLPPDASTLLNNSGHDTLTIWDQELQDRPDAQIAAVCQEDRLIVMRLSSQSRMHVLRVLQGLLPILKRERIEGRLWIAGDSAVRIHGEEDNAS